MQLLYANLADATVPVAPAVVAGYPAVHGTVKHTMPIPSQLWQIPLAVIRAAAVGFSVFLRVVRLRADGPGRPVPGGAPA